METSGIIVLENSLKYLRRNLVFPKRDENEPGIQFYLKFIVLNLSTAMFLTGNVLHLIMNIKRKTFINLDLDLALAVSLIGSYCFNFSYLRQVKNIIKLYRKMFDFRSRAIPNNFSKINERLNTFSKCHYVYITAAVLGLCTAPLLENEKCQRENIEHNLQETCGLIGNIWLPIDLNIAPYKQIYYVFQMYSSFVIYQTSSLISFSIMETVEHLILRFQEVRNAFLDAVSENEVDTRRKKFRNAVDYHVYVIEISKLLNSSFNQCMFVHVLLTGAILGCASYRLTKGFSLDAICLFVGWIVSLIMVCLSGQRLRDESIAVGEAISQSNWLHVDKDIQRGLILVLIRCQKPIFLHAGPFGYMTYAMILTILKTSYSYLMLLSHTA